MTPAEILFGPELASGRVTPAQLDRAEVLAALKQRRIPPRPVRLAQRLAMKAGRLDAATASLQPQAAARQAVLGEQAGPPRVLVRVDEFPHYDVWDNRRYGTAAYERFHEILTAAGVPYLVAVVPRIARRPLDPQATDTREHDDTEQAMLERLKADGVSFATHGLDHRTRHAGPRRHSELCGLPAQDLRRRLADAHAILAERGIDPVVFVAPYNRFDAAQLPVLAERYEVVAGGPESVPLLGFHPAPALLHGTLYLPSYPPLYDRARNVLPALDRLPACGEWVPVTLHWGWEADDGFEHLRRLADRLAPLARTWKELIEAA